VSLDGPLARVWKVLVGRGIATSTPAGLGRLVQVVEADMAVAGGTDGGRDAEVGP
jgi:hypothetical protein